MIGLLKIHAYIEVVLEKISLVVVVPKYCQILLKGITIPNRDFPPYKTFSDKLSIFKSAEVNL